MTRVTSNKINVKIATKGKLSWIKEIKVKQETL